MTEREIDWPPIIELAGKVSHEIARKWAVVVADDVKQEILTYLIEKKEKFVEVQDDEDFMRSVMWVVGKRYASKERNYYDLTDDQYWYTPEEVRVALMSFVYDDEKIGQQIGKKDDLIRSLITDNITSARSDAMRAMSRLKESHQAAVYHVFICGLPAEDENQRRTAYRAVDSLAMWMNRNVRTGR